MEASAAAAASAPPAAAPPAAATTAAQGDTEAAPPAAVAPFPTARVREHIQSYTPKVAEGAPEYIRDGGGAATRRRCGQGRRDGHHHATPHPAGGARRRKVETCPRVRSIFSLTSCEDFPEPLSMSLVSQFSSSYALNVMPYRVTLPLSPDSQRCACIKGPIIGMHSRYGAPWKAPLSSAPLIALKPFAQARSRFAQARSRRLHDRPMCPAE